MSDTYKKNHLRKRYRAGKRDTGLAAIHKWEKVIPISYSNASDPEKEYIKLIHEMASDVKYGSITITIQDGKIVQIEKIEKIRLKSWLDNRRFW